MSKIMKQPTLKTKSEGNQQIFTVAEVARRWGMSERHVRRELDSGRLNGKRFGSAIRITAADLALYEATRPTV